MDVVYFGSREIYGDFVSAINSLRAHNDANVYAVIEDDQLDIPDVNYIRYNFTDYFNTTNTQTKWKQFGPIRAAFTKIFPDKDKILSIDCDTIVTGDITELWETDMEGYHVAMVRERDMTWDGRPYYNNGVCLMNLRQIREDGVDDLMIKELNTTFHKYVGQDVMQMFLKIKDLDSTWNASKFTHPALHPKIIHYADRTDWRNLPEVQIYR